MNQESGKQKSRKPMGKGKSILVNLLVTLVVGLVYFYFTIPAINPQSADFYSFLFLLCVVYMASALVTSGFRGGQYGKPRVGDYFRFIKQQCLPVGVFMLVVVAVALVGQLLSLPIFRAGSYRELLTVEDGTFSEDISQISFDKIPTLDRASAEYLGDRQMGTLSDMVSQFEYPSDESVQINYQGRPVRVSPIAYADLIKWFTNRSEGLPAYVVVDMVTQEANVVRLQEGMKYSFSEPLNRNIMRHLRFQYPTYIFSSPRFEIDEEGQPWWIAPRVVKTIGLFGGTDLSSFVLNIGGVELRYGAFITSIINFLIMAFVLFCLLKAVNKLTALGKKPEAPAEPEKPKNSMGGLLIFLVVGLLGGGAALYYVKFMKPKQSVKGGTDLDEFDFDEYDEDEPEEEADSADTEQEDEEA